MTISWFSLVHDPVYAVSVGIEASGFKNLFVLNEFGDPYTKKVINW